MEEYSLESVTNAKIILGNIQSYMAKATKDSSMLDQKSYPIVITMLDISDVLNVVQQMQNYIL
jgi:hypothetical protein